MKLINNGQILRSIMPSAKAISVMVCYSCNLGAYDCSVTNLGLAVTEQWRSALFAFLASREFYQSCFMVPASLILSLIISPAGMERIFVFMENITRSGRDECLAT